MVELLVSVATGEVVAAKPHPATWCGLELDETLFLRVLEDDAEVEAEAVKGHGVQAHPYAEFEEEDRGGVKLPKLKDISAVRFDVAKLKDVKKQDRDEEGRIKVGKLAKAAGSRKPDRRVK